LRPRRASGSAHALIVPCFGVLLGLVVLVTSSAAAATSPNLLWRATVAVGKTPIGIAVDSTTNNVFVANSVTGSVSVISALSNKLTNNIAAGAGPYAVAVNPLNQAVYVANFVSNDVWVISPKTATRSTLQASSRAPSS
jgi:YVTN family beta-propeller protein